MSSLFVVRGNDQGSRCELDDQPLTLGRESSNNFQLHDHEVSRHHAEISWDGTAHVLSDLGSSNGTFVNGRTVKQHRLGSGDQVQLGSTLILYTGPAKDRGEEDLSHTVAIASPQQTGDRSQIVRAIPQVEGSRLFQFDAPVPDAALMAPESLQVIYNTALAISHTLDVDQLLDRIMDLIFQWLKADRGCLMLLNPENKRLEPKVRRQRAGSSGAEKITISKTILDYVLERNEGVLTSDAQQDDRWNSAASIMQMGIREAICVPMKARYDVVGAIYIDTSTSAQEVILQGGATKFREEHLKLMIAIAHQAALAIEDTRYYSAMLQAERLAAIGQTIATLSHHIKNILQGIRGGSYLIEMGLSDHDENVVRKGWKIVEKNQQKISTLVMDMLTFSKEREPELMPGNLNEVVGDVVELAQAPARERQVELAYQPAEMMPTLIFDPEGLHRSVLNIVSNALDAVGEVERPGRVAVRTEYAPAEAKVRVIVEDNGPGIPADQLDSLFSPFISTKKSRGTGLGLPVSQKIIAEHGGRIDVRSTVGEGSCFVLEIPAVAASTSNQQTIIQ